MSPLKLFEYLAAGLPVAAADLPGVTGVWPERVRAGARGLATSPRRSSARSHWAAAAPGETARFHRSQNRLEFPL